MFNTAARIGHNKFVVLTTSADPPEPVAVLTGSTNWTFTGLAGQSNDAVLVEDAAVAAGHFDYWRRLHGDVQPVPDPIDATLNGSKQGPAIRSANTRPVDAALAGGMRVRSWYAPNTARATKGDAVPPDLADVFAAMDGAKRAIFLLCFNPGSPSVIGRAVAGAIARPGLLVQGAVSAAEVLPHDPAAGPRPKVTLPDGRVVSVPAPAITPAELDGHKVNQLLMVRASALRVATGDLQPEILTTGFAVIHDKIVVIDPMSERDCVVVTGSHNLGYKASYCNDENLLIIRGNPKLAAAYAAHVLDVFEHYRLRAVQEERYIRALQETGAEPQGGERGGFLDTSEIWQKPYFDGTKGQDRNYVLDPGSA
jgi:phosphatidylserine/phosphatidylglycerophosphate/cardiolipin synthase-like enzyme